MNRRVFQGIVITALAVLPMPVLAQYSGGWQMMPMHRWGLGWLWMLLAVAFWILVFVALVYLVKYLIQATNRQEGRAGPSKTPLDILKERYARGEIDREEFLNRKKDLTD